MTIKSPCIGVCSITLGDDICRGCGRTLEQIRDWGAYTNDQRREIMTTLDWVMECAYLDHMALVFKGKRQPDERCNPSDFNQDSKTFLGHCQTRQRAAHDAGRHDSAVYIQHIIDDMQDVIAEIREA